MTVNGECYMRDPKKKISSGHIQYSVIIPVFNEEDNIRPLLKGLLPVMNSMDGDYEILFIDDGSVDRTYDEIHAAHKKERRVKCVKFVKNCGQTAAMQAGFDHCKGDVFFALDGDLQNDPKDIPKLLEKLDEGYDMVSGWRFDRADPGLEKKLFSRVANKIEHMVTGLDVHDYGCTLKAYKRKVAKSYHLHSQHHRFLPPIAKWEGFKVGELKVRHHQRKYGKTKYGFGRLFRGFADLLALRLWYKHRKDPMDFLRKLKLGMFTTFLITITLLTLPFLDEGTTSFPLALILGILGAAVSMGIIMTHRSGVLSTTIDLFERSLSQSRVYEVATFLD